ncbi:MAG TPA: orotidine-5'-phosphate decarboxylase [Bacteroidia bacterium]|nr:orotidine-5'-phosphate decarboxylase [Bacteroidia bacterium]
MNKQTLFKNIEQKQSFLCIGLDVDIEKIPAHIKQLPDAIFQFNKAIIDATHTYCVAYKPNTAFYECYGVSGWQALQQTIDYIKQNYPDQFIIADAKRGDIGNTSAMYAQAFFKHMQADAVTVAPYMGADSVKPFLNFSDKWVVLLALTSNSSAADFQLQTLADSQPLYKHVLHQSLQWGNADNMMYVVGATQAPLLAEIRKIIPQHFLLVPGVGAQGGSLAEVAQYGLNSSCGLLVNASRSIIYASNDLSFAKAAGREAQKMQLEMAYLLQKFS